VGEGERKKKKSTDQQVEGYSFVSESADIHERGDDITTGVVIDQHLPLVRDVFVGGLAYIQER
jgi:hypothetical protein